MTLWDGLTSANKEGLPARIMILGATNRIQDIDEAILRRMPKKFPVSLPGNSQRKRILKLILKDTKIDTEHFDMDYLTRVFRGVTSKKHVEMPLWFPSESLSRSKGLEESLPQDFEPKRSVGSEPRTSLDEKGVGKSLKTTMPVIQLL